MQLQEGKKVYFASDFHLGAPSEEESKARELKIIQWLTSIQKDAQKIFLVGDLFDFWFEYKHVVPKGHVRFLGKLAEIKDSGVGIQVFTGNHDLWMKDYFTRELGIPVHHQPIKYTINGKRFYIGHGDGLGPGDKGYKALKKIFTNKVCQWLFRQLHPDLGYRMANYWSKENRLLQGKEQEKFLGEDKEWLIQYCKEILQKKHFDYFIFGHRHLPIQHDLNENSKYINLGEWFSQCNYAVFDGNNLQLKPFDA